MLKTPVDAAHPSRRGDRGTRRQGPRARRDFHGSRPSRACSDPVPTDGGSMVRSLPRSLGAFDVPSRRSRARSPHP